MKKETLSLYVCVRRKSCLNVSVAVIAIMAITCVKTSASQKRQVRHEKLTHPLETAISAT